MQHPTVFGMVTTRKSEAYTHLAVQSFFQTTPLNAGDEFVLIDNDSVWDTQFACYDVVRPTKPQSFAANANMLLQRAQHKGAHVVFLNNDVYFTHDWSRCLGDPHNVVVPSCNQTHTLRFNNFVVESIMQLQQGDQSIQAYLPCVDHMARQHVMENKGQRFQSRVIAFYAVSIPPEVYQSVGLFDESFGLGGAEDVDYRLRTVLCGFDCYYSTQAYLLHFHGKSTWLGGETPEQTQQRDQLYWDRFISKWGFDLTHLLLGRGDWTQIINRYGLWHLVHQGNWTEVTRIIHAKQ